MDLYYFPFIHAMLSLCVHFMKEKIVVVMYFVLTRATRSLIQYQMKMKIKSRVVVMVEVADYNCYLSSHVL